MKIINYRYKIAMGYMMMEEIETRETAKCYIGQYCRIPKKEDDKPILKDRTSYPYIDFYSTKDQSKEYAINKILEFFKGEMM